MEQLKVAIAEKIIEASSGSAEDIKLKMSKIQRFSDFAEACKSLMIKYPEIETELLQMVRNDDFDAVKASRNVDFIINREQRFSIPTENKVPEIPAEIPIITPPPAPDHPEIELPEDDYTEGNSLEGEIVTTEVLEENTEVNELPEEVVYSTVTESEVPDDEETIARKKQMAIVWKILAAVVAIVVLYFVIRLVLEYWQTILIILGGLALIYFIWLFLKKRKNNT